MQVLKTEVQHYQVCKLSNNPISGVARGGFGRFKPLPLKIGVYFYGLIIDKNNVDDDDGSLSRALRIGIGAQSTLPENICMKN